jgi:two-component system, OmpR family, response regulator
VARILVVDDEPRIVGFVRRVLAAEGWAVDTAGDGVTGLRMARTGSYDLTVLDLLLPGLDGTSVLAQLMEERPDQRVLVLSAMAEVEDRVRCLRLGAVDYLVKPFAIAELVARVHTRLRPPVTPAPDDGVIRSAALTLDCRHRTVDKDGTTVHLSEKEFLLLRHLLERTPRASTREELLSDVWGLSFDPGSNVVEVCIGRVRQKLGADAVETVRGVGYRVPGA